MLVGLRKAVNSWAIRILFLLLIAGTALFGIESAIQQISSSGQYAVAEVGGTEISRFELSRVFESELQRETQARLQQDPLATPLDPRRAAAEGRLLATLNGLIDARLESRALADQGFRLSPAAFQAELAGLPPGRLEQILQALGLTSVEDLFAFHQRDTGERVMRATIVTATVPPPDLVEALARARGARRTIEGMRVLPDALSDLPPPTDEDLRAAYDAGQERLRRPPTRDLTIVVLTEESQAARVQVDEAAIRAEYERNVARTTRPPRRRVATVASSNPAALSAVVAAVRGGASLAEAAAAQSLPAPIDRGLVAAGELQPPALAEAAFALPAPGITDPVAAGLAAQVAEVTEILPAERIPFEEVQADLTARLRADRADDLMDDAVDEIEDEDLPPEAAAERFGAELVRLTGVTPDGRAADGGVPAGLSTLAAFGDLARVWEEANDLEPGETSRFVAVGPAQLAVRVDAANDARVPDFAEIRDQLRAEAEANARREAAQALAERLAAELRAGAPLPGLLSGPGVAAIGPVSVTREGAAEAGLPAGAGPSLFDAAPGTVLVLPDAAGPLVLRAGPTEALEGEALASARAELATQLKADLAIELLEAYRAALRDRYGVEIDQAKLDRLYAEQPAP